MPPWCHRLGQGGGSASPHPPAGSAHPSALPWDLHVMLGIPRPRMTAKSILFRITGHGVGILGHLPARQSQERGLGESWTRSTSKPDS